MSKTEIVELAVLCLVYKDDEILVQDRQKDDWNGIVLPGGHLEKEESFVMAVKREIKEETNLDIYNPKLVGIKQHHTNEGHRYLVLLFKTNEFAGELKSSDEGEVMWVKRKDLDKLSLVADFHEFLEVFESDELQEFIYEGNDIIRY